MPEKFKQVAALVHENGLEATLQNLRIHLWQR